MTKVASPVVQRDLIATTTPLVLAAYTVIVTIEVPAVSGIASSDRCLAGSTDRIAVLVIVGFSLSSRLRGLTDPRPLVEVVGVPHCDVADPVRIVDLDRSCCGRKRDPAGCTLANPVGATGWELTPARARTLGWRPQSLSLSRLTTGPS